MLFNSKSMAVIGIVQVVLMGFTARAQDNRQESAAASAGKGLGQLHRDFGFPGAVRPWERFMHLNPNRDRRMLGGFNSGFGYLRPYGQVRPYRGSYGYVPYGSYYGSRAYPRTYPGYVTNRTDESGDTYYAVRMDRAYELGVAPGKVQANIRRQALRSMNEYRSVVSDSEQAFLRGDYPLAARHGLLAAQLNQSDPATRLHATHALVAMGRYQAAAAQFRSAVELQPKIALITFDIRESYGRLSDFSSHLNGLRKVVLGSSDPALWFLLNYYYRHSDQFVLADETLEHARHLAPDDRVIARYAKAVAGF